MRVEVERLVGRPPADVFRFIGTEHFANHPKWDPAVVEMTPTSAGPMGRDSTARLVRADRGKRVEGSVTVTEYEPDRSFGVVSRFGPFELRQRAVIDPVDDRRARLRLTIDTRATGPVRLLLPLLRPQFRRTMRASLATIARLVETRDE